ncbi:putative ABC transporter ATP-binding protein [Actinoplanes missouriensis 431]|uniref:Putative ABC transporter ATP-binding protein n=1 Tax=Actinoplanes missouriensis (strain ATCC 14538 / DSM 43046 / CBS 188.64 / JCM 3121 / NBRC 102363 / NCIMB 12654 / NRRL B-3342 / UNCC 431) TaxID=512565 RepID=I0HJI2_ACTM4|nr:ABC transporter ATP-binding protein [Actinoplanes missouriensis]BAL93169.1 putative ABC transporter ATP-binding protein [Actinoplanes missouriensis 431]
MTYVLALAGVSRTFPTHPPVAALIDVDLQVARGDYLGIVGPSGSGKSTLLNVLGLLDVPTGGSYTFEGAETTIMSDRRRTELRGARIGFVFQSFHLLMYRTVLENVMLGGLYTGLPAAERRRRAVTALDRVGMGHRHDFLPSRLSGGERQRVAIARALVGDPALLLCDEPTGNLDSANTASVLDLFDELRAGGATLLVITHDPAVAARADRQVRIADGRLSVIEAARR